MTEVIPVTLDGTVRRNTVINIVGAIVPIITALATIPVYLSLVGLERYGVLALAWLFLGYFGVFNFGFGRATANQIARLRFADQPARQRIFWTAFLVTALLGALGGLVFFLLTWMLTEHVITLSPDLRSETIAGLPWLAGAVPFAALTLVCLGALEGREHFLAVNGLELITATVYQLAPLAVAYVAEPNMTWLFAAIALAPVLTLLLAVIVCSRLLPLAGRPRFDMGVIGTLARYGGWVTASGIVSSLLTIVDRVVISSILGVRAVTYYTVPYNVVTRLTIVSFALSRALFPRFSVLAREDAREIGHRALHTLAALVTPIAVLGVVVIEPFLGAWVGTSFAERATPVAVILMVGVWANSFSLIPFTLLQGQGRPDLPAIFHIAELPPYILALWFGVSVAGIEGAALAWTARTLVDAVLLFIASGFWSGRQVSLIVPAMLMGVTCAGALTTFGQETTRLGFGIVFVALALIWSWVTLPRGVRNALVRRFRSRASARGTV